MSAVSFCRDLGWELVFKSRREGTVVNILLPHSGPAVPNPSFLLKGITSFQEKLGKKIFAFKKNMEFFQECAVLFCFVLFCLSKEFKLKALSEFSPTGNMDPQVRCIASGILFASTGLETATV